MGITKPYRIKGKMESCTFWELAGLNTHCSVKAMTGTEMIYDGLRLWLFFYIKVESQLQVLEKL